MTYDLEHLGRQVDKLSDAIEENTNEKGENSMNDIAGLLARAAKEHVSMEDKPEVCKALDRVKDELKGMLEYKHLDEAYVKKHGSHHYATASFQESMHMFLALDDFFTALIPLLTAEEKAEWSKFRASLPE